MQVYIKLFNIQNILYICWKEIQNAMKAMELIVQVIIYGIVGWLCVCIHSWVKIIRQQRKIQQAQEDLFKEAQDIINTPVSKTKLSDKDKFLLGAIAVGIGVLVIARFFKKR